MVRRIVAIQSKSDTEFLFKVRNYFPPEYLLVVEFGTPLMVKFMVLQENQKRALK